MNPQLSIGISTINLCTSFGYQQISSYWYDLQKTNRHHPKQALLSSIVRLKLKSFTWNVGTGSRPKRLYVIYYPWQALL